MSDRDYAHALVPDFPDDVFAGTAEWYATYRPQYPQELLDELLRAVPGGAEDTRLLVDLACGPGTVCLAIHRHFDAVLAVDLEPDMVAVGQELARVAGADNIEWMVSRAEDVELPQSSVHLVTVGNGFHRLNRPLLASRAFGWLQPQGVFAEIGSSTRLGSGDEPWQEVVSRVYRHWIGRAPNRPEARSPKDPTRATTEEVLVAAGYTDVCKRELDVRHVWTADKIVGYLFSTSHASRTIFGDLADEFADAVRAALLRHDPRDQFPETLSTYLLTGARP